MLTVARPPRDRTVSWTTGHKGSARALVATYAIVLSWVLLNPSADLPTSGLAFLTSWAEAWGLPEAAVARMEPLANVAIFVPLPVLGALVFGPRSVTGWTGLAFALSFAVEVTQRVLLTGRSGSTSDIVANTLGALLGAILVWGAGFRNGRPTTAAHSLD